MQQTLKLRAPSQRWPKRVFKFNARPADHSRMASPMDRDDFERRLLALVRNYMDEADVLYPEGYEVGDFMVLFEVFTRVSDSEALEPWSGGVRSGLNSPLISFSSTTSAYWLDEAWLVEALARVRERRRAVGDTQEAEGDD